MLTKVLKRRLNTLSNFPSSDFQPTKYTGLKYKEIDSIRKANIPPALFTFYKKPVLFHQGYKQWLFDDDGKRYLDLFGGICTVSVGHCHPKLVSALNEQLKTLWHTTNIYYHPKVHQYAEKLMYKMPGNLKVVYFVNSGTEANDLAVVLAKAYTGNQDVITLRNSYHGDSTTMMSVSSTLSYKFPLSSVPGVHHAMLPDPFRGIWGGCRDSLSQVPGSCECPSECKSVFQYISQLEEIFQYSIPNGKLAAMFVEPIQGVGGAVQYPKGYVKEAYKVVKNQGGLFVADEVQTGFGRTGDHYWGFEGHDIVPDIVTMAKGIGNGFPLGAVVTTPEIAAAHKKALYFNTFGGNPLASTVGETVLDIIEEENLQKNCKDIGDYFVTQLKNLQKTHSCIGDVRGKGLMLGIELVEPGTKQAMNATDFAEIMESTKDMGVLFGKGGRQTNVLRIKPPMCISKGDVNYAIDVIDKSLRHYKK